MELDSKKHGKAEKELRRKKHMKRRE